MTTNAELLSLALLETAACQDPESAQSRQRRGDGFTPAGPFLRTPCGTRMVPTTAIAMNALAQLAERLRNADRVMTRAVGDEAVRKQIAAAFGETMPALAAEGDARRRWRLLRARTCERIDASLVDLTHYVPVWLFVGQDCGPVEIGPVRLVRRADWLEQIAAREGGDRTWFRGVHTTWAWSPGDAPPEMPGLTPEEILLASQVARSVHPDQWVACVHVEGCEQGESRRRAILAAKVALDAVRLLLPHRERASVRTAVDAAAPIGTDILMQATGRDPAWGVRVDRPGVSGGPGLARAVLDDGRDMLDAAGTCIGHACKAEQARKTELPELRDRWYNSVHWFGQASLADEDYVSVVMLVISLDILSGAGEERGITRILSLLTGRDPKAPVLTDGRTSLETLVSRAYGLRSRIAHGSVLALHGEWERERAQLGDLAATALHRHAVAQSAYAAEAGEDAPEPFAEWLDRRRLVVPGA